MTVPVDVLRKATILDLTKRRFNLPVLITKRSRRQCLIVLDAVDVDINVSFELGRYIQENRNVFGYLQSKNQ